VPAGVPSELLSGPLCAQAEVLAVVAAFNSDPRVHGILVQLPLPKHIDEQVCAARHAERRMWGSAHRAPMRGFVQLCASA
jgi:hypothetical protein